MFVTYALTFHMLRCDLPLFDFLTVVEWDDMKKGVEYIRAVLEDKSIKRCEKRLFEEYLDHYFKKHS